MNRRWVNSSVATASTYSSWAMMKRRCFNPQDQDFYRYGGRGILVCARWKDDYDAFYEDMGPRPEGLTLERRNRNGDYTPDNCYWADRTVQANNRSTNRLYDGDTLAKKARAAGISRQSMGYRANHGIPAMSPKRPEEAEHGTASRYSSRKHRCRCGACREAWRLYNVRRKSK